MPENSRRCVAAVRFSALGDVAMTIPVIYSACLCHPDIQFLMITKPRITGLFINPPENLAVAGIDPKNSIGQLRQEFNTLHDRYRFDSLADLQHDRTSGIMRLLCRLHGGITVKKITADRHGERMLTRRNAKRMLPLISRRALYRDVFYRLGLPIEYRLTNIYQELPPADTYSSICTAKADGEKWIGVAPFANYTGKIYPVGQMESVVGTLSAMPGVKIFLFGNGDEEQAVLQRWEKTWPNVRSLAECKHGFSAELALMSHLDVMLSMDSANMHLAALVNTPVVSVWGATHPYCGCRGWRQSESRTVQLAMVCRPCSIIGDKPCRRNDYYCLKGIKPQTIIDQVLSIIND